MKNFRDIKDTSVLHTAVAYQRVNNFEIFTFSSSIIFFSNIKQAFKEISDGPIHANFFVSFHIITMTDRFNCWCFRNKDPLDVKEQSKRNTPDIQKLIYNWPLYFLLSPLYIFPIDLLNSFFFFRGENFFFLFFYSTFSHIVFWKCSAISGRRKFSIFQLIHAQKGC